MFSNRRKTPEASSKIKQFIKKHTGIPEENIAIYGIDEIENYIDRFPDVDTFERPSIDRPLMVTPDDIEYVVDEISEIVLSGKIELRKYEKKIVRTKYAEKNKLNNLSQESSDYILTKVLPYSDLIERVLANPSKKKLQHKYSDAVDELKRKQIEYMEKENCDFFRAYNHFLDSIFEINSHLRQKKSFVKVIFGYMYYNCDIGRNKDD